MSSSNSANSMQRTLYSANSYAEMATDRRCTPTVSIRDCEAAAWAHACWHREGQAFPACRCEVVLLPGVSIRRQDNCLRALGRRILLRRYRGVLHTHVHRHLASRPHACWDREGHDLPACRCEVVLLPWVSIRRQGNCLRTALCRAAVLVLGRRILLLRHQGVLHTHIHRHLASRSHACWDREGHAPPGLCRK